MLFSTTSVALVTYCTLHIAVAQTQYSTTETLRKTSKAGSHGKYVHQATQTIYLLQPTTQPRTTAAPPEWHSGMCLVKSNYSVAVINAQWCGRNTHSWAQLTLRWVVGKCWGHSKNCDYSFTYLSFSSKCIHAAKLYVTVNITCGPHITLSKLRYCSSLVLIAHSPSFLCIYSDMILIGNLGNVLEVQTCTPT